MIIYVYLIDRFVAIFCDHFWHRLWSNWIFNTAAGFDFFSPIFFSRFFRFFPFDASSTDRRKVRKKTNKWFDLKNFNRFSCRFIGISPRKWLICWVIGTWPTSGTQSMPIIVQLVKRPDTGERVLIIAFQSLFKRKTTVKIIVQIKTRNYLRQCNCQVQKHTHKHQHTFGPSITRRRMNQSQWIRQTKPPQSHCCHEITYSIWWLVAVLGIPNSGFCQQITTFQCLNESLTSPAACW